MSLTMETLIRCRGQQKCFDSSLNTYQRGSSRKDLPDLGKAGERIMDITGKSSQRLHSYSILTTTQNGGVARKTPTSTSL
jgi:hypothetical protein